jgi:hypothetical protein
MKKTISVDLGKEDYTIALMNKLGFIEESRHVIGSNFSEEKIQLTFEGRSTDYHENDFIKVKNHPEGYFVFYSLRVPNGYFTNSEEKFKQAHDKENKTSFEIHSFETAAFDKQNENSILKKNVVIDSLDNGISIPLRIKLTRLGLVTLSDLEKYTESEIISLLNLERNNIRKKEIKGLILKYDINLKK